VRPGAVRTGKAGGARQGEAWSGQAWQARRGTESRGRAGLGRQNNKLKGENLMSKDFVFNEERSAQHFARMLHERANFLRHQADLLDRMAEEMASAVDFCKVPVLEDSLSGRR
jgi:hypothetical protein